MCGIAGVFDLKGAVKINEMLLDGMASPLKFRGPDQEGKYLYSTESFSLGFVHRRLSILDLSDQARQPMQDHEEKLVLVFNGEVYNYAELRTKLTHRSFRSTSDTEVVLYAIKEWGIEEALKHIEGMFALAVFDHSTQTLILARDRFGEKPLFYSNQSGAFAFSSDLRSFSALPIRKSLNTLAIGYYLGEMSTPGDQTVWNEVKKLPPAHFLKVNVNSTEIVHYWKPEYREKQERSGELVLTQSEALLEKAVQKTMVSDVPVGCFLSGGIDSSLVALYASRYSKEQLKTFTVGFTFDRFDETQFARYVAKLIKSDHHEITLDSFPLREVNTLLNEYGEPFADSSAIPTYYISRFAAQHVKVCLGGDGGDELFGGYGSHKQAYRMQQWFGLRSLRKIFGAFAMTSKASYLKGIMELNPETLSQALYRGMGFSSGEILKLTGDSTLSNSVAHEHVQVMKKALESSDNPFDAILCASILTRLPNDYLVKTDRASMFNSLELRTPFLDRELVEFTSSLSAQQLMKGGMNKYLTKTIARNYFSKEFIDRPKMGFGVPIGEWMKKEWKNEVEQVILSKHEEFPLNVSYVEELWKQHQSGVSDHTHRLWIIYTLNRWLKEQSQQ